jgi:hypothetical protein
MFAQNIDNYFRLLTVIKVLARNILTAPKCVGALSNYFTWPYKSLQLGQTSSCNKDVNLLVFFLRGTARGSGTPPPPPPRRHGSKTPQDECRILITRGALSIQRSVHRNDKPGHFLITIRHLEDGGHAAPEALC